VPAPSKALGNHGKYREAYEGILQQNAGFKTVRHIRLDRWQDEFESPLKNILGAQLAHLGNVPVSLIPLIKLAVQDTYDDRQKEEHTPKIPYCDEHNRSHPVYG
jgi:hypothetical protein